MEIFEIHITGEEKIIEVLKSMNIKTLHAELKNPLNETIGVEYMSSFTQEFNNYELCKKWVDNLVNELIFKDVKLYRVKIECPYFYNHYKEMAVYLECHFPTTEFNKQYPFVLNVNSKKYVSTDRVYLKSEFEPFIQKWGQVHHSEIEYCLFDDNVRHDDLWVRSF